MKRKTPSTRPPNISGRPPSDPVTAYAQAVDKGRIVAGPHVRDACRRHLRDLVEGHKRGLTWDMAALTRILGFFPDVLRLAGGQFEGRVFDLAPSQAFIVGSLFAWKRADGTRRFRRAYIEAGKGSGKALAVDTQIATPTGWSAMGTLQTGDFVLDEQGRPNRITRTSDVMTGHDCYAVTFDDGEVIIADADHLWATEQRRFSAKGERLATHGVPKAEWGRWHKGLRTSKEIAATLRYANGRYQSANHSVPLAAPLALPDAALPIDPFVLGVWLGDGDSDCARFTCADNDDETIENLLAAGCAVGPRRGGYERAGRYRIGSVGVRGIGGGASLNAVLRRHGLLGNKHIPEEYLRASFIQRLALIQGLMDTDGHISPQNGQCEFTSTRKDLATGFRELAHTLGLKTSLLEGNATIGGRIIGRKWRVLFFPPSTLPVFRLSRKRAHQIARHSRRRLSGDRRIVDCRPVPSVPVKCISVASASQLYLAGRAMVPTHNSPLAAGIGIYCLLADDEPRAEVYAAASKRDQAMVLYRDAVAMREQSPHLKNAIHPSGGHPIWNMAHIPSGSFFRPISSEDGQSGPRPSCALCDELHEHRSGVVVEMLERGFKFRRQPLLLMITNAGSDRHSVCWEEHQHAVAVAAGDKDDDTTFSYVCALDIEDQPLDDPSCWVKANPLLDVTITTEYLAGVVAQAKAIPGKLNGILRLHFCVWTDAERAWLSRQALEPVMTDFEVEEHQGEDVYVGADLSAAQDLTALAFVVPTGFIDVFRENADGATSIVRAPTFDAWVEVWTPGDTASQRGIRDSQPYDQWIEMGFLRAPKGRIIRLDYPAAYLAQIAGDYRVRTVAYDRYAYRRFEEELDALGLDLPVIEHPQGGKRRGAAPADDLSAARRAGVETPQGLWMPGSVADLELLILERRIRLKRNPVLMSAMMSAALEEDPFGNRWLSKRRATNRIDAAVALAMAVGAATAAPFELNDVDIDDFLANAVIG